MDLLKSSQAAREDFFAKALWNQRHGSKHHTSKSAQKRFAKNAVEPKPNVRLVIIGAQAGAAANKVLRSVLADWQVKALDAKKNLIEWRGPEESVYVLQLGARFKDEKKKAHYTHHEPSLLGVARDMVGQWYRTSALDSEASVAVEFLLCKPSEMTGAILGLGLAQYKFLDILKNKVINRSWSFCDVSKTPAKKAARSGGKAGGAISNAVISEARALFRAMNLSRHLANLPAEIANANDLALLPKQLFRGTRELKVKVLSHSELKKDGCGLLIGVGQGSTHGSRLVHIRYRPSRASAKPIAFVGKGVIFDTGGLDIKPSSGMRLMKKDMSGVATMLGLVQFISDMKLSTPCDFYLPLAENSISDKSMRPGDILRARNGLWVEIDNTDAEGRLVMADAIDMAVSAKGNDAPCALVDVSTLTGAMRVAVGLDCAGYFSTDSRWAHRIEKAAQAAGELTRQMPLIEKYMGLLSSSFADLKNSSDSGFGGAITAALFLRRFVGETPWVHFDVMSWNNTGHGALSDGANAQCLQTLARLMMD